MKKTTAFMPELLPVMPLRNAVVFPQQIVPLAVGREKSLSIMHEYKNENTEIFVTAQKEENIDDPNFDEIYKVGTICSILKVLKMPDGTEHVVVQGLRRAEILDVVQESPFLKGAIRSLPDKKLKKTVQIEAMVLNIRNLLDNIVDLAPYLSSEHRVLFHNAEEPDRLVDLVAMHLNLPIEEKQEILELTDPVEKIRRVHYLVSKQYQVLDIGNKIQDEVQGELNKTQRRYVLREQLKAIKKELGEDEDDNPEISEIRDKLSAADLPENVLTVAEKELERLSQMSPSMAEYSVIRTYLDWLIDIPWRTETKDNLDVGNAAVVLDEDHYGLEKVKDRILEFLSVLHLKKDKKSPILCFVGPPGVGKTSLGKSIARSLNRKFVRVALGGLHDEAEIRGHRKTYVGAMPGKIIQNMKKVGSNNPVFILDEIDKLGRDFRGDPSSALLEVLDPEQNYSFTDNYVEIEFDLSKTFFIATANVLDTIPAPLRDRMDIIQLSGYTTEEKVQIGTRYLVPKQIKEHGLRNSQIKFNKNALVTVIENYTREAGVRNFERRIADICRKVARGIVEGNYKTITINKKNVEELLGPAKFDFDTKNRTAQTGVATGLAWTPVGGDILFIEATTMPGKGQLILTGQLGDVMKESAKIALNVLKAEYKDKHDFFKDRDIHIHVPTGAIPKDGPSAGITMYTALYSLMTETRVRHDIAMTGEITLRGQVLPIGGVKEKVLAAKRAGIQNIILPEKNRKDLSEIPEHHLEGLHFSFVKNMEGVLAEAMVKAGGH
jgi:ATP-dependent Lon protease